jgi:hypothetical protein
MASHEMTVEHSAGPDSVGGRNVCSVAGCDCVLYWEMEERVFDIDL